MLPLLPVPLPEQPVEMRHAALQTGADPGEICQSQYLMRRERRRSQGRPGPIPGFECGHELLDFREGHTHDRMVLWPLAHGVTSWRRRVEA